MLTNEKIAELASREGVESRQVQDALTSVYDARCFDDAFTRFLTNLKELKWDNVTSRAILEGVWIAFQDSEPVCDGCILSPALDDLIDILLKQFPKSILKRIRSILEEMNELYPIKGFELLDIGD